jgi:magnesium chelatase family protein
MEQEEALEVTKIYSAAGSIPPGGSLIKKRPFRSPHHTISYAGMVGGGSIPQPGQISLAHRGVLFMDEFPEFPRAILEMLRQPLEEGVVTISRSKGTFSFPCRFILVASGNPCPCGFFGSPKPCICTPGQIRRYKKKLSGPIMDRIDLFIKVQAVKTGKLQNSVRNLGAGEDFREREPSNDIRERVIEARNFQRERFKELPIFSNSEMTNKHIKRFCHLDRGAKVLLEKAVDLYSLSARSYFKVLKVSRTIADLTSSEEIREAHVGEAIQYRYKKD